MALAIPGIFVIPIVYVRTPYNLNRFFPVEQPVQFDHRHHAGDDGIECLYCHSGAERTPYAGVPATEVCMGCHNQVWNKSPMLEPVRRSYFSGEPLLWKRVHHVPDFVYFNHAIHVTRQKIACAECHGDVAGQPLALKVRLFTMGWCLDCHRREARTSAAGAPGATMASVAEPTSTSIGSGPTERAPLRKTNCSTCHR